MAKKWIINDGKLVLGNVPYHRDLVLRDTSKIRGGGWWHFDAKTKNLYLYGESHDFGTASKENVLSAKKEDMLPRSNRLDEPLFMNEVNIYFSKWLDFERAIFDSVLIQKV